MKRKEIILTSLACLALLFFGYELATRFYFHDFLCEVPNLVQLEQKEAEHIIHECNLEIKWAGEQHSSLPAGQVLRQEPKAKAVVKEGRRIQIWTSKGPELLELPNFVGMNFLDAKAIAEQEGLIISAVDQYKKNIPYNEVIATDPAFGENIARGSKISFLINGSGKEEKTMLRMPDVIGYSLRDAKRSIREAQLELGNIYYRDVPGLEANIVLDASTAPGRNIPRHSKIHLTVSQ